MLTSHPVSEPAERAAALVMRELAKFRVLDDALQKRAVGRLRISLSLDLSHTYGPIASMVSVVEEFATTSLGQRIERELPDPTRFAESARSALLRNMEGSWPGRLKSLDRWFGPGIKEFTPFTGFLAFVEARNAISHGLGRLTRRQLADGVNVRRQLGTIGVRESGGQIVVDADSVLLCAICCKASVLLWDWAAQRPLV